MTSSVNSSLWLGQDFLVLASGSSARQHLLRSSGIPFETCMSGVDERALETPLADSGASGNQIATALAAAKALGFHIDCRAAWFWEPIRSCR